jgi:hypothetical protein
MTNQQIDGDTITASIYKEDVSRFNAWASGQKTSSVTSSGVGFASGTDILGTPLSFTADGTSDYLIRISATSWTNNGAAGSRNQLAVNLDGSQAGYFADSASPAAGRQMMCEFNGVIPAPSAGTHTVNVRLGVTAGTATVTGGSGVGANPSPILVAVAVI